MILHRSLSPAERDRLRQFLQTELPRHDRLIVILHYYEALTAEEIAAVLGDSPQSVGKTLTRVVAAARMVLGRVT